MELLLGRPLPDIVHVDQRFQVEDLQLPLGSVLLEVLLVPGLPGDGVAVPVSVARQLVMVVMLLAARRQQLERGQGETPALGEEHGALGLQLPVSLVLFRFFGRPGIGLDRFVRPVAVEGDVRPLVLDR